MKAAEILSENGAAAFILPIELRDSEIVVRWSASAPTSLANLTSPAGCKFGLTAGYRIILV